MEQTKTELELLEAKLLETWREHMRLSAEVQLIAAKHDESMGTVQRKAAAETLFAFQRAWELYSATLITFMYFLDDEDKAKGKSDT